MGDEQPTLAPSGPPSTTASSSGDGIGDSSSFGSDSDGSSDEEALSSSGMQLRDYQQDCIAAILEARQKGVTRQLVSLPTGGAAGRQQSAAVMRTCGL